MQLSCFQNYKGHDQFVEFLCLVIDLCTHNCHRHHPESDLAKTEMFVLHKSIICSFLVKVLQLLSWPKTSKKPPRPITFMWSGGACSDSFLDVSSAPALAFDSSKFAWQATGQRFERNTPCTTVPTVLRVLKFVDLAQGCETSWPTNTWCLTFLVDASQQVFTSLLHILQTFVIGHKQGARIIGSSS